MSSGKWIWPILSFSCLLSEERREAEPIHALSASLQSAQQATETFPTTLIAHRVKVQRSGLQLEGGVEVRHGDLWLHTPSLSTEGLTPLPQRCRAPSLQAEWVDQGRCGHLDCPGPIEVETSSRQALLRALEGQRLVWRDGEHVVEARQAVLLFSFSDWALDQIELEGDVRLNKLGETSPNAISRAAAQRARISVPSRHCTLESDSPHAVTLWNRLTTRELACQRLHIWQDLATQEWMQQGEGQVCIRIASDELSRVSKGWIQSLEEEAECEEGDD